MEIALALTGLLVTGAVVGLLFFVFVTSDERRRVIRSGEILGVALGVVCFVIALAVSAPATFSAHAHVGAVDRGLVVRLGLGARSPAPAGRAPPSAAYV